MNSPEEVYSPSASVVIITRNRADQLERALAALEPQTMVPSEIIIVDHSSEDRTPDVIASHDVIGLVSPPSNGIAGTRRIGAQAARGEVILWCDDDCEPCPEWVERMLAPFADPAVGIVGGRIENVGFPDDMVNKGRSVMGSNGKLRFVQSDEPPEFFGNGNLALRRTALEQVGGYDPFLRTQEEIDVAMAIDKLGYQTVFAQDATVRHHKTVGGHKHGRLVFGGQAMRLYVFFKNQPPRGLRGWRAFAATEAGLLWTDAKRSTRMVGAACIKRSVPLRRALIEVINTYSSRAVIPWLYVRARRMDRRRRATT